MKAVQKGLDFIKNNPSSTVAESLQPSFQTTSLQSLAAAVESYKSVDAWKDGLVMTEDSYIRLLQVMSNAGQLQTNVAFSDVVNNSYANQI